MATLTIENLENALDAFRLFPEEINEAFNNTGIEVGELLTVYARQNHKWQHRDHNLEKDIGYKVFGKDDGITVSFGLGFYPSQTRVFWSKLGENVSYGTILHDGAFGDEWIDESWENNKTEVYKMYDDAVDEVIKKVF